MWLDFCFPKGCLASYVYFHEDVSLATTECCNLSGSATLKTQTVSVLSLIICILTKEKTQLSCISVVLRQKDTVVTSAKVMFINKYFFLGREREVSFTLTFLQILFPVLSFPFPTKLSIFQFISMTYEEVIRQTLSLFSLHSVTFPLYITSSFPLVSIQVLN